MELGILMGAQHTINGFTAYALDETNLYLERSFNWTGTQYVYGAFVYGNELLTALKLERPAEARWLLFSTINTR